MANNGEVANRGQTCAACKHQRKKCTDDCLFAPYFSRNNLDKFQSVVKIFGISNFSKMLKNLESQEARKAAVESIIWEASMWEKDPVHGPLGAFRELVRPVEFSRLIISQQQQQQLQQYTDSVFIYLNTQQQQADRNYERSLGIPAVIAAPPDALMNQETVNGDGKGTVSIPTAFTNQEIINGGGEGIENSEQLHLTYGQPQPAGESYYGYDPAPPPPPPGVIQMSESYMNLQMPNYQHHRQDFEAPGARLISPNNANCIDVQQQQHDQYTSTRPYHQRSDTHHSW